MLSFTFYAKAKRFILCIATTALCLSVAACTPTTDVDTDAIAIVDVNVIPMDREEVLEAHTVVVQDGRITAVGPANETDVPEGAVEVEGTGRYLMPGLAEMHGHIPGPDDPQYAENVLFLYLSNGVTTVRNMSGHPYHLELRENIEDGTVLGPTIYAASPWMGDDEVSTPDDAERMVREYNDAGFDLLKMGSISLESYDRMAETAHEVGIPFAGHIPAEVGLERALEARQRSIDHLDRYVEFLVPDDADTEDADTGFFGSGLVDFVEVDRIDEAVHRTLEAGTWNVPTLSLVEHLESPEAPEDMAQWPEMRYMPAEIVEGWVNAKHNFQAGDDFQPDAAGRLVEIRQQLTRALHENEAPIALGSDAPQFFNVPGFSIHHEMEMMVASGLTPYEVLVTGTRNPAIYVETPEEFGTIEVNRRADIILLEANPLEDIANVQRRAGVMVHGQWLPEDEIQQRLEEIAAETDAEQN